MMTGVIPPPPPPVSGSGRVRGVKLHTVTSPVKNAVLELLKTGL